MAIYKILCINIECNDLENDYSWKLFENQNDCKKHLTVQILHNRHCFHGIENYELDLKYKYMFRREAEVMLVDSTYENALIFPGKIDYAKIFLCQLFYTNAIKHNVLYFHSSLIEINKKGLMFLGKSGIGKTTQAELWNQYRRANIINGDVVFVQEINNIFWGYGTPWHGSSSYCENKRVEVCAMVVLRQSRSNSIRELFGFEKVKAVSESVYYPKWLENGIQMCVNNLNSLLLKMSVFELSCRPDEDAVEITEKAIF